MARKTPLVPLSVDPFVQLIDHIYRGAVDPGEWSGIVEAAAAFIGGPMARLHTPLDAAGPGGLSVSCGLPRDALELWSGPYFAHDVWLEAGTAKGLFREGSVVLDAELVHEEEFARSQIYRELLARHRVARLCAGVVFGHASRIGPPTHLSVYRGPEAPRFGSVEKKRMRRLLPHLTHALGVLTRLRDAEQNVATSLGALDRLACGVLLIDGAGGVAHANREAERIFAGGEGIALRRDAASGAPRLEARDSAAQAELQTALAAAAARGGAGSALPAATVEAQRSRAGRPFVLEVAPLPETSEIAAESGSARAIVFVNDPERPNEVEPGLLRRLYGITAGEARFATHLVSTRTLADAAARCGIGLATARSHLRSLFAKTGARRQPELVRLLLSLCARQPL